MTTAAPFEQEPTTNLGFDILGYVVEKCDMPKFKKAEPIESLSLALVAWVAGPEGKISVEDLSLIIASINELAIIWNEVNADKDDEKLAMTSD